MEGGLALSRPCFHLHAVDIFPNRGYIRLTGRYGLGPHDAWYVVLMEFEPVLFHLVLSTLYLVYAFYRRDRQIGVLLSTVFAIRCVLSTSGAIFGPPLLSFDEYCRMPLPKLVVFCYA